MSKKKKNITHKYIKKPLFLDKVLKPLKNLKNSITNLKLKIKNYFLNKIENSNIKFLKKIAKNKIKKRKEEQKYSDISEAEGGISFPGDKYNILKPTILDAYLLKDFFKNAFGALFLFIFIYLITQLVNEIPYYVKTSRTLPSTWFIIYMYILRIPYSVTLLAPPAFLFSTIFTLGNFYKNNEVVAAVGSGVYLYRFTRPIWVLGLIFSIFLLVWTEFVAVPTWDKAQRMNETIRFRKKRKDQFNLNITGEGNLFYSMRQYKASQKIMIEPIIIKERYNVNFVEKNKFKKYLKKILKNRSQNDLRNRLLQERNNRPDSMQNNTNRNVETNPNVGRTNNSSSNNRNTNSTTSGQSNRQNSTSNNTERTSNSNNQNTNQSNTNSRNTNNVNSENRANSTNNQTVNQRQRNTSNSNNNSQNNTSSAARRKPSKPKKPGQRNRNSNQNNNTAGNSNTDNASRNSQTTQNSSNQEQRAEPILVPSRTPSTQRTQQSNENTDNDFRTNEQIIDPVTLKAKKKYFKVILKKSKPNIPLYAIFRIDADRVIWNKRLKKWVVMNGIIRYWDINKGLLHEKVKKIKNWVLPSNDEPYHFEKNVKKITRLRLLEGIKLINKLKRGNKKYYHELVDLIGYHFAFQFGTFIIIFIGLTMGKFHSRKNLFVKSLLGALLLFLGYYAFFQFGSSLGKQGIVNPYLAPWLGNLGFFFIALLLRRRSKT